MIRLYERAAIIDRDVLLLYFLLCMWHIASIILRSVPEVEGTLTKTLRYMYYEENAKVRWEKCENRISVTVLSHFRHRSFAFTSSKRRFCHRVFFMISDFRVFIVAVLKFRVFVIVLSWFRVFLCFKIISYIGDGPSEFRMMQPLRNALLEWQGSQYSTCSA